MTGKILFLTNHDRGLYNFRKELIQELLKKYKVYISLPYGGRVDDLVAFGCVFINTNFDRRGVNPIHDVKLLKKYWHILKETDPDVVLTYTIKPNLYGGIACLLRKKPYIINVTGLGSIFQKKSFLQKGIFYLQKFIYKKAKCLFFQNEENLKYFYAKNTLKNKRVKILPGSGVNLTIHKLEEYPSDDGYIRFITISRIMRDKGYDELFEVIENITTRYDNVEFHIVGDYDDHEYKKNIERLLKRNKIKYHGILKQEEIHSLIAACHCMIHPSHHEGMSNVLLEAAAAGRPILASDIPGCREIFDENVSGFGFRVNDAEDITEKVVRFIELPYDEKRLLGIAGRKKIERKFDRNFVIQSYMEEIDTMMKTILI